uniref:Salivary lipocalin n=1 Tax=Triatoma infestans TaxID=30076 RepID=A6YPC8_TRIIF|nr:salivary lipocalin [Triatoma infestans]
MKTIITVIFVGILTYTVAQKSGCQNAPKPMPNLNINNFYKNTWYETHMKDARNSAICRECKFEVTQKGIVLTYEGQSSDNKPYTVTCSSTQPVKQLNPSAPVLYKCAHTYKSGLSNRDKHMFFTLIWTVVETDYKEYALAHRCMKYDDDDFFSGAFVLVHRDRKVDGSKAAKSLEKNKLKLTDFTKFSC